MRRLRAAATLIRAAVAAAARIAGVGTMLPRAFGPQPIIGPLLPWTPPPPPRVMGPWRPRIRPELRTIRERVVIYYTLAEVPVAAALALAGWPVGGVL